VGPIDRKRAFDGSSDEVPMVIIGDNDRQLQRRSLLPHHPVQTLLSDLCRHGAIRRFLAEPRVLANLGRPPRRPNHANKAMRQIVPRVSQRNQVSGAKIENLRITYKLVLLNDDLEGAF
jgi:hypothetical protein